MIRVYTAQTVAAACNVQNVLEANGIPCVLRNEFLSAGLGELPMVDCWPELWVADDSDAERARQLIADAIRPSDPAEAPWQCSHCAEEVDSVFARCWNCGTER